jgi:hypothetical protein
VVLSIKKNSTITKKSISVSARLKILFVLVALFPKGGMEKKYHLTELLYDVSIINKWSACS